MNYKEENSMCKKNTFSFQLKKKKILLLQCKPTGLQDESTYVGNKSQSVLDLGGQRENQLKFTDQTNCTVKKYCKPTCTYCSMAEIFSINK